MSQISAIVNYVIMSIEVQPKPEVNIQPITHDDIVNASSVCDLIDIGSSGLIVVTSCSGIHVVNHKLGDVQFPVFLISTGFCTTHHLAPSAFLVQTGREEIMDAMKDILRTGAFATIAVSYDELYDSWDVEDFFLGMSSHYVSSSVTRLPADVNNISINNWLLSLGNSTNCIVLLMDHHKIPSIVQHLKFSKYESLIILPELDVSIYETFDEEIRNVVFLTEWIQQSQRNIPFQLRVTEAHIYDSLLLMIDTGKVTPATSCQNNLNNISLIEYTEVYNSKMLLSSRGFTADRYRNNTALYITRAPELTEPVGMWTRSSRLNIADDDLFNRIDSGFGNITIVVGTLPAEPFIIKLDNGEYEGFCIDILDELALRLNFRYELTEPEDGLWGGMNPDGSWNGLVRKTMDKEFDMSIGPISLTAEREEVVDYTTPVMEDGAGIILRKFEDTYGKIFRSFKPFTLNVWITIGFVLLAVGLILGFVDKVSPYRGKTSEIGQKIKTTSVADDIWIVYGSYMEQGTEFTPSNASGRFILGFWWIFTILIISSYTASLAAFLTVAFFDKPIKTIDDLTSQSEIKPLVKQGSNLYTLLKKGETERYRKLYELLKQAPEVTNKDEAIKLVLTGNYAYLTDQSQLQFLQKEDCDQLILGEEPFNSGGIGFIVTKGSPLLSQLSYNIIKLQEAGLIRKWTQKWWVSTETCTEDGVTNVVHSLELSTTSGPFIAFAGSTMLALICLIIEHICFRFKLLSCANKQRKMTVDSEDSISNGEL